MVRHWAISVLRQYCRVYYTTVVVNIDLWLKQSDKKKSVRAAESQFKTGLAVLNAANAEHPMLSYFSDKEQEWQAYAEKQRKQT